MQGLNASHSSVAGVIVICNPENKEVILINEFKMTFLKNIPVAFELGLQTGNIDIKSLDRNIIVIGILL